MKILVNVLLIIFLAISLESLSQKKSFVPDDFKTPDSLVTDRFKLKPLSSKYSEMDYKAVMGSLDHLKGIFGPKSAWPNPKMTLSESKNSIEEDYKLFIKREGFCYSVLNIEETEVLGCVYIFPSWKGFDSEVVIWVSRKAFDNGLDPVLLSTVENWIDGIWPFKKVAYPGRKIKWEDWLK